MTTNNFPATCSQCGQTVLAGKGDRIDWRVRHRGECPPWPGVTGPVWRIYRGEPGSFKPKPSRGFAYEEVLRETLFGDPVPADAPGRHEENGRVSAIVTVIAELPPEYIGSDCEDRPFVLHFDDGWFFQAIVRLATADEAEELLAEEATAERRAALRARVRDLFYRGDDRERPDHVEDETVRDLPSVPGIDTGRQEDRVLVDSDARLVWLLTYNGRDGDAWAHSNYHSDIAYRMPLTQERRDLIADLTTEFGLEDFLYRARVVKDEAAAKALIRAGWHAEQVLKELGTFWLSTSADVEKVLANRDLLTENGWWAAVPTWYSGPRFRVEDAIRLAEAGRSHKIAESISKNRRLNIEQILAAQAPQIPDGVTRVIIKPNTGMSRWEKAMVCTTAESARHHLAVFPETWVGDRVSWTHEPMSVTHTAYHWVMFDDGSIVLGAMVSPGDPAEGVKTLSEAAERTISLLIGASNGRDFMGDRSVWHPFREATAIQETKLDHDSKEGRGCWAYKTLARFDITLPDSTVTLWKVIEGDGGWAGGDADNTESYTVHDTEAAARSQYRDIKLRV